MAIWSVLSTIATVAAIYYFVGAILAICAVIATIFLAVLFFVVNPKMQNKNRMYANRQIYVADWPHDRTRWDKYNRPYLVDKDGNVEKTI